MIKLRNILLEYSNSEIEYLENIYDVKSDVFNEFLNRKEGESQPWRVVPFPRLEKIWNDFAKSGVVRDEKGLDKIIDIIGYNILKLQVNTELSGHTMIDPDDDFEEYGITTDEEKEEFYEYIIDPKSKQYRISDFAMDKLFRTFFKILKEDDYSEKLILVDHILNIVHQRSDLASWFVEGGSRALSKLSGVEEYD